MARCTILTNPRAGLHRATATPEELRQAIRVAGIDAEVQPTDSADHMCAVIRELQSRGAEKIAVAGGDGTVRLAAQCLACTGTALAIIPSGTRNNFAHALGLPLGLDRAMNVLGNGRIVEVDLGRAHGAFFTEAAGVGVFADILDAYGKNNKNFWRGAYAIAKTFFNLRAKRLRLSLDGNLVSERAVMCTVANGYRMGAGAPLAPGASVTDGELDVVILGDLTRFELLRYYRAIKANRHMALPKVTQHRARAVRIEAALHLPVHVDDAMAGKTPVTIEIVPKSLRVVVKA